MIATITGPSGVGKTTIARYILAWRKKASLVLSFTSRGPRDSDLPGEYRTDVSLEEFEERERRGEFAWICRNWNTTYATHSDILDGAFASQELRLMLLVPEVLPKLLEYAKRTNNKVYSFYIVAPSEEVLRERLSKRGEQPNEIEKRIEGCRKYNEEIAKSNIPYIYITNDGLPQEAAQQIIKYLSNLR